MTGGQLSSFTDLLSNNGLSNSKTHSNSQDSQGENAEVAKSTENSEKDALTKAMERLERRSPLTRSVIRSSDDVATKFQKLHQLMMKNILELLFGNRKAKKACDEANEMADDQAEQGDVIYNDIPMTNINVSAVTESIYTESESFSFDAKGIVKTSDGRSIDVDLSINMSRSFTAYTSQYVNLDALSCIDPLVINFDDAPSGLTDMKFFFDLDADGTKEEISSLDNHSGFLALDKNNDGKINDGSELFGTKSGDGYKDLAQYDLDGNGWIDENDEVFGKLKIWVKDSLGNDCLYSLKDKGVGAIYLGSTDTNMALRSEDNSAVNGFIKKTGIFLYENGNVGTTQHVDLVS